MDDDIEMVDAPTHDSCQPPEDGRAGLRPPPGFEYRASGHDTGEGAASSTNQLSDRHAPHLLPYESEMVRPLRVAPPPGRQSPMAIDMTNSLGSESDVVGESSRSRRLPQRSPRSPPPVPGNSQGSENGLFPFPPPVGDMPSSNAISDPDSDETEEEHEPRPRSVLQERVYHTPLTAHHRLQLIDVMRRKGQEIKTHEEMGNTGIFHLDWSAGNPNDPCTTTLDGPNNGKGTQLSAEDSAYRERIEQIITDFTNKTLVPNRDDLWGKTMFFGDWIASNKGERDCYIEIQVKRVSGADQRLMERCGIDPRNVWLPLGDLDYHDIKPNDHLLSTTQEEEERPFLPKPLALVSPGPLRAAEATTIGDTDAAAERPGRPSASIPHSVTIQSFDGIVGSPLPPRASSSSVDPVISPVAPTPRGSGQQLVTRSKSVTSSGKRPRDADSAEPDSTKPRVDNADQSLVISTGDGERPGTRRRLPSLPVTASPSWGSNISNNGSLATSNGEADDKDETADAASNAGEIMGQMTHNMTALQKLIAAQRKQRIESLIKTPDFPWRRDNSFIYCVRIVALPEVEDRFKNHFTGPRAIDRKATLLGSGGWIVPSLEDRLKWQADNKENRPALPCSGNDIANSLSDTSPEAAKTSVFEATGESISDKVKKTAQVCRAHPAAFDLTGNTPPRTDGEPCPVWRQLAEPCLEDVYWMVWQLLAGKQYFGFRSGLGFVGQTRKTTRGDPTMLAQSPFKSPSPEALRLSAQL